MDRALINDIDRFIEENKKNILRDIARLVEVNSVEGTPAEGAPYGAGPRKALDVALAISEELGLNAVNCEDVIGYAELGKGDEYLATVTHVDVVPVGDGWKSDPFKMREKEGFIIGRGVLDDKGPAVICLYALKYLLESGTELKYPIRALLGTCEETGMQDVVYYLENYPAPLFAFSPDADFPVCNGEKGITQGRIVSAASPENVLEISGGFAHNAIPDSATALVIAGELSDTDKVHAEKQGEYWKLTATGLGGHASLPAGTDNAIGNLVSYLLDNGIPSDNERPYFEAISLLHAATDGSRINCAASDDVFEPLTIIGGVIGIEDGRFVQTYDSRYPTSTNGETIRDNMQAAMGDAVSVIMGHDTVPFYVPLDNPAVQVCINAYNDVTGENAKPFTIGGGTYARDFPNAVSFGPEHHDRPQPDFVGPIHGVDEGASVEYLLEALKIYIVALINLEKLDF